jgi:hypothetical protein
LNNPQPQNEPENKALEDKKLRRRHREKKSEGTVIFAKDLPGNIGSLEINELLSKIDPKLLETEADKKKRKKKSGGGNRKNKVCLLVVR